MTESDWSVGFAKSLGMFLNGDELPPAMTRTEAAYDDSFFVVLNAYWEKIDFVLPDDRFGERWSYVLDTAEEPSFAPPHLRVITSGTAMPVEGRSVVVLVREPPAAERHRENGKRSVPLPAAQHAASPQPTATQPRAFSPAN